jgi:hypothetical protein
LLRNETTGYGTIAQQLGISKARVQQIANAPGKLVMAAFAFMDESGQWHGDPAACTGPLLEAPTVVPFTPADKYNPLAGQTLAVMYGPVADDGSVSLYTLQLRGDQGRPLVVRMTHPVQDALFGPPVAGTPELAEWAAARERRRRARRGLTEHEAPTTTTCGGSAVLSGVTGKLPACPPAAR